MCPFPITFWASYQAPPSPTPNPTPTPTPFACKVYLVECETPGACGSGVVGYTTCAGLSATYSYTGIQANNGFLLPCARNYPSPPFKSSGAGAITFTIHSTCS